MSVAELQDMLVYVPRLLVSVAVLARMPTLAPLGALGVFMIAFAITHDAAHGALGRSRRMTSLVLACGGLAIGTSGHALRLMHLRHHARELAPDDLEGAAARMSFWAALVASPRLALALHVTAYRSASARERRWQALEYVALAIWVGAAFAGPRPLATYAAVALAMQVLAPWWAGHIPHRAGRLRSVARRLASVTSSPTLASLAHHDVHHRRPKLPTWCLEAASLCRDGTSNMVPQRATDRRLNASRTAHVHHDTYASAPELRRGEDRREGLT
jgi:fatty acid desaturase